MTAEAQARVAQVAQFLPEMDFNILLQPGWYISSSVLILYLLTRNAEFQKCISVTAVSAQ